LPERLKFEAQEFERADGLDFTLDEAELAAAGTVVFRGTLTLAGRDPIELEVRYPDSFPYLRPEVFAPRLKLGRHQNPYRANLCLLERSTRQWAPSNTGAGLVAERVPKLLTLLEGDAEQMRREEAPQGEPASHYCRTRPGAVVFVPSDALRMSKEMRAGEMSLAVGASEAVDPILRAGMTTVKARGEKKQHRVVARADEPFAKRFSRVVLEGRWVRLDKFPEEDGGPDHLLAAARAAPGFETPRSYTSQDGSQMRVYGVVCEEEVRQSDYEDVWLFVVELTRTDRARQGRRKTAQTTRYVARGERLSAADLGERIPTLDGMRGKKVALVGLGALGAPLAFELARAQVGELRVLDDDLVEAGTTVRWPFGISAVGHLKTQVVRDVVARDYPYTRVAALNLLVGSVRAPADGASAHSEAELLTEFLDGVDLVIDATAEVGVQQLLAALADDIGIPQVYVTATAGGWGGIVARITPGRTGCWWCLRRRIDDKSIPHPPCAETGTTQPRGCSAPTWTGTSFDALPLVAQAARTATFTLLGGRDDAASADVFICSQEAETSVQLRAPEWTTHRLDPHPECEACAARNTA